MKCVTETLESVHLQVECTFEYGIDGYWSCYIVKNMEMYYPKFFEGVYFYRRFFAGRLVLDVSPEII
jgi:hypothetical protein